VFLTTDRGRDALEAAHGLRGQEPLARRAALERRGFTAPEIRAALAQDDLRVRAAAKTPLADVLLFTRDGLEQATTATVADDRARRFAPFPSVADLGAGLGLDTIALARAGPRVVAVERDPARVGILRHNVVAAGLAERVTVVEGDAVAAPPAADAAFLDPDRRPGGHRTRDPDRFEPPADAWPALAARYAALLVKLPPATLPPATPPLEGGRPPAADAGLEWVSLDGEMKECRRGFGALALPRPRRALLLPAGTVVEGEGRPWPAPRAPAVGDVLLLPDPAVVVAGLVGDAAAAADARPLHPRIAALVGPRVVPWARGLPIDAVLPADPRAIRRAFDAAGCGEIEVRTRGVEDPAETWRRRIGPPASPRAGAPRGAVLVTRGPDDRYVALLSYLAGCTGGGAAMGARPAGMP